MEMDKDTLYAYKFDDIVDKKTFLKYVVSEVKDITDTRHINFEEYDDKSTLFTLDKFTEEESFILEIRVRREVEPYFRFFTKSTYDIRISFGEKYITDVPYGESCTFNMTIDKDTYDEIYAHVANTLQSERTKAIGERFIAYKREKNINRVTET